MHSLKFRSLISWFKLESIWIKKLITNGGSTVGHKLVVN